MEVRLDRMRKKMDESGLAGFYCRDISNVKWLTEFKGVFDDEPAHLALVTSKKAFVHTDSRYRDACERAAAGSSWIIDGCGGGHAEWASRGFSAAEVASGDGFGESAYCLGIEDDISLREYRGIQLAFGGLKRPFDLVETESFVKKLRAVKDESEISAMRAAQAITDAAFEHIVGFMREGMTELQVKLELEDAMRRLGADGLAFESIVASGENGAAPHSIAGERRLQAGDMVVMDFGARKFGYCSDMTRTVCIGEATPQAKEVFAAVREANEAVEAMIRPHRSGSDMHHLAEDVLAHHGFAGKMGHGLGHGVGIDIHELPVLSPRNSAPLVPGNVVTVEPGVYLPGEIGCRLEDFGVVTEDGYEVFTKSTHELVII